MIDAHPSPEFPDRPDHPDFRLLAEIVQANDAAAEMASADIFGIAGVDQASAIYLIKQRAIRMQQEKGLPLDGHTAIVGMAMWLDGFAAGVKFNQRRSDDAKTGTAGEKGGS